MNTKKASGSCIISEDVIAAIACAAALEVPGVAELAQRPVDLRGIVGAGAAKAVKITNVTNETVIDIYVNLRLGAHIQETGSGIQHGVKMAVQSMTGKPVNRVNVHILGMALEDNTAQEPAAE